MIDRDADDVALLRQVLRPDAEHLADLLGLRRRNHGGRFDGASERRDEASRADEEGDVKSVRRADCGSHWTRSAHEHQPGGRHVGGAKCGRVLSVAHLERLVAVGSRRPGEGSCFEDRHRERHDVPVRIDRLELRAGVDAEHPDRIGAGGPPSRTAESH